MKYIFFFLYIYLKLLTTPVIAVFLFLVFLCAYVKQGAIKK